MLTASQIPTYTRADDEAVKSPARPVVDDLPPLVVGSPAALILGWLDNVRDVGDEPTARRNTAS